ncbi:hypothetical protein [Aquiflexum lacus]|uniref:hypothetical protein n=1 Tax=Aquiflexum lacus TaxID=2483805 RepID=UPI0018963873|nr:hypothetical protein [Aquiflexum lacus]
MKKTLMIFAFVAAAFTVSGQTSSSTSFPKKTGCEPGSCGPKNTKIEESNAVFELRNNLQKQISQLNSSSLALKSELKNYEIPKGKNEEESLLIIMQTVLLIKAEILKKASQDEILPELQVALTAMPNGTRQTMVYLVKETELLAEQIQKLL